MMPHGQLGLRTAQSSPISGKRVGRTSMLSDAGLLLLLQRVYISFPPDSGEPWTCSHSFEEFMLLLRTKEYRYRECVLLGDLAPRTVVY